MKKKNIIGSIIMLIVVILIGIFVYFVNTKDKDMKDNNSTDTSVKDNDKKEEDNIIDKETATEISKEKMPVMISLANQKRGLYGYCGEFDEDSDYLTVGDNTYDLSSKFKSTDEVKNYLSDYVSDDLINEYFDKDRYQEKDNRLYCMVAHKGVDLAYLRNETMINSRNIKYSVLNLGSNSFDTEVVISYYSVGDSTPSNLLTISASIENINGKYVVTRYSDNTSSNN